MTDKHYYNMSETKEVKNLIQNPLTLTHIYKYYIKDLDKDSRFYLDYKTFRAICSDVNKMLSQMIIEDGYFFKVPYRLGTLRIKKKQVNLDNLKHDYGLYNRSGGKYKNSFLNEHSGGYYVRYYWSKNVDVIVRNKTPYSFIPTRENKRKLSRLIREKGIQQINKYFD